MQEGSENEEEDHDEEEENTDYLTDSNKENETDEENNVSIRWLGRVKQEVVNKWFTCKLCVF